MASRHLSLRISEDAFRRLDSLAKNEHETVSETARRLIEEGLRMVEHPGVVFRPGVVGRRAALADGPQIWKIIDVFPEWDTSWDIKSGETLGATSVNAWQVMVAQRYYRSYPDEIDELIRLNREAADQAYGEWLQTHGAVAR
jgi:hypothetical protein